MNGSSTGAVRGQGEPCYQAVAIFQTTTVDVLNKSDITTWILLPATTGMLPCRADRWPPGGTLCGHERVGRGGRKSLGTGSMDGNVPGSGVSY